MRAGEFTCNFRIVFLLQKYAMIWFMFVMKFVQRIGGLNRRNGLVYYDVTGLEGGRDPE